MINKLLNTFGVKAANDEDDGEPMSISAYIIAAVVVFIILKALGIDISWQDILEEFK